MSAALELAGVSIRQNGQEIVSDVTLSVAPGEVLGLVGPNGAGKTSLLRAALALRSVTAGQARLGGRPAAALSERERAALASYLPQERRLAWNMPAWRVVALGAASLSPANARAIAHACLDELEVGHLAERGVLDMSGGERARVLLARLLATRAPLLVVDEPAAGLDPDAQFLALERLRARAQEGAAVIVTLHDLTLAARTCDRLAVLHQGRLRALAAPAVALTPERLTEVFGLTGGLVVTAAGPTLAATRAAADP